MEKGRLASSGLGHDPPGKAVVLCTDDQVPYRSPGQVTAGAGGDVLSLMLQSRYDDGSAMSHSKIADRLLTLLSAGHETTATTLAWAVERLRRHPAALRAVTILEVRRTRPVIDLVGRYVKVDGLRLGPWTPPKGYTVIVSIAHEDESLFPDARAFDPSRFLRAKPDLYQWISFGGGARRCLGAAFATMEMNVVLRTLLRDFTLMPTAERDERLHSRGIANAPAKGGLAVVRRRECAAPPVSAATAGARS